jgi:hypothetical protein
MRIESSFPAVKKAAWETVEDARSKWIEVARDTAQAKVSNQAATRGYDLQVGIEGEKLGHQSARIFPATRTSKWGDDPWFLRLFEYGAVHIQAMPFMRPGARKGNKAFLEVMDDQLEGTIRRRARTRRR